MSTPAFASDEDDDAGRVVGTLAYMPPEQARGAPPAATADVYSLGAVLYTIMAGHAPYQGSAARIWAQLVNRPPQPGCCGRLFDAASWPYQVANK